jgi:hypothetical protein
MLICHSSLSDYSDYDYDSSDNEWRAAHPSSRRQSAQHPGIAVDSSSHHTSAHRSQQRPPREYASLEDDVDPRGGRQGLLDPNDPFGDPFADDMETPVQEKPRMQCELVSI